MQICQVLEISPYELLLPDDAELPQQITVDATTDLGILIDIYSRLDKEERNRILGYVQGMAEQKQR
jgi:hypothetical protein